MTSDAESNELPENEYFVEQILNKKVIKGEVYYLVKWEGYPISQATWEPLSNVTTSQDLINQYEARPYPKSRQPDSGNQKEARSISQDECVRGLSTFDIDSHDQEDKFDESVNIEAVDAHSTDCKCGGGDQSDIEDNIADADDISNALHDADAKADGHEEDLESSQKSIIQAQSAPTRKVKQRLNPMTKLRHKLMQRAKETTDTESTLRIKRKQKLLHKSNTNAKIKANTKLRSKTKTKTKSNVNQCATELEKEEQEEGPSKRRPSPMLNIGTNTGTGVEDEKEGDTSDGSPELNSALHCKPSGKAKDWTSGTLLNPETIEECPSGPLHSTKENERSSEDGTSRGPSESRGEPGKGKHGSSGVLNKTHAKKLQSINDLLIEDRTEQAERHKRAHPDAASILGDKRHDKEYNKTQKKHKGVKHACKCQASGVEVEKPLRQPSRVLGIRKAASGKGLEYAVEWNIKGNRGPLRAYLTSDEFATYWPKMIVNYLEEHAIIKESASSKPPAP